MNNEEIKDKLTQVATSVFIIGVKTAVIVTSAWWTLKWLEVVQ